MTDQDSLGRRIARYRKRLNIGNTKALADRTGGRVSEAVLQNIESGRKADISVVQLLEISRGLGVSPLLLLAPFETPEAPLDLPGVGPELQAMSASDFDAWVRGVDTITVGRAPGLVMRWEANQIRSLVRELRDWRAAAEARRRDELTDPVTHERAGFSDIDALAQAQREIRIDRLCEDLAELTDIGWARRPWREDRDG